MMTGTLRGSTIPPSDSARRANRRTITEFVDAVRSAEVSESSSDESPIEKMLLMVPRQFGYAMPGDFPPTGRHPAAIDSTPTSNETIAPTSLLVRIGLEPKDGPGEVPPSKFQNSVGECCKKQTIRVRESAAVGSKQPVGHSLS
jgi:hypothetical protein